jgi:hypothetical protein
MNNEVLHLEVNNICEGYGCFKKAATKIAVKVGQLGSISLDLCTDCVKKFDENSSRKTDSQQNIVDMGRSKEAVEE